MENNTQDQHHQINPNKPTHRFLLCFGFSRKRPFSQKIIKPVKTDQPISKKKTKHPWFSWLRTFNMKKSATKTVPLVESSSPDRKIRVSKSKKLNCKSDHDHVYNHNHKLFSRSQNQITNHNSPCLTPATAEVTSSDQASKEKPQETRYEADQQNIGQQNGNHSGHVDPPTDESCQRRLSFCRRGDHKKTGFNQPCSPDAKRKSTRTESIRRSASFPVPIHPAATPRVVVKQKYPNANKFDLMIGMSMIMVTLTILLVWGRLCAILCTSAWFYFVPRLVNHDDIAKKGLGSGDPNLNSEEYKKKVVLEGFLERRRRNLNLL